jgi:hypothetical protein
MPSFYLWCLSRYRILCSNLGLDGSYIHLRRNFFLQPHPKPIELCDQWKHGSTTASALCAQIRSPRPPRLGHHSRHLQPPPRTGTDEPGTDVPPGYTLRAESSPMRRTTSHGQFC